MGTLKKGDLVEVQIEKLTYGGAGLARVEGQVIFVDYSAPGDRLEVQITEAKKNFARGKIVKILDPATIRTTPPCKVFGQCGGCQWQHISYSSQVQAKQQILQEVINRYFPSEGFELEPLTESPDQFHYRNRIQVRAESGKVGYFEKGSHDLVAIQSCPIAEEPINKALVQLLTTNPSAGKFRLQVGLDGAVSTTALGEADEPLGFAQVNNKQNERLQTQIEKLYLGYSGAPILDLYGGYGNLSLSLANQYPQIRVEVVEWNRQAIEEGIARAKIKGNKQIRFINSDVGAFLQRIKLSQETFVILDPPRDGCSKAVIQELAAKAPKVIVYISCDPMTWGRDGQLFLKEARQRGSNYRIAPIHGLDMFPQTDHIEVFSVFERKD